MLGLAFRFAIAPFFAHQFDFTAFVYTARMFYMQGVATFFVKWPYTPYLITPWPYPVLSYFLVVASQFPVRLLPWDIAIFHENFTVAEKFFFKLPLILCDLAASYILLLIAERNGMEKYAKPLSLAYWLNPLTIYVSSFYGTFDSVTVMFALAAFYQFTRGRYILSAAEIVLGAAVKFQTAVLLLPLLVILWVRQKRGVPAFLMAVATTYTGFFILPRMIQQIPYLNMWMLQSLISASIQSVKTPVSYVFDMTYNYLLVRTELAPYIYFLYSFTPIVLVLFAGFFVLLTYLIVLRGGERFESLTPQVAYIVGTYMAFYLSFGLFQHYSLWALPFLLLLLPSGKIQRNLVFLYNALPIFHSFWRDSIFYFINEEYSPYGVGWGSFTATGTIFSIICLLVLQAAVRDQLLRYRLPLRIENFFSRISPEKKSLVLYATLTLTFTTIVAMVNINGVYWASIPFIPLRPLEFAWNEFQLVFLPRDRELVLLYLAVTLMVPLPLALSLPREEARPRSLAREAKILVPLLLTALTTLTIVILSSTLTYVGTLKLVDHLYFEELLTGWQALTPLFFLVYGNLPPGGFLTLAHGGIVTSVLIWAVTIITLLAIIPIIDGKQNITWRPKYKTTLLETRTEAPK